MCHYKREQPPQKNKNKQTKKKQKREKKKRSQPLIVVWTLLKFQA